MNDFYEHHMGSIEFGYRCFDGILLNGLIQPFQQPERVIGFFNAMATASASPGTSCAIAPNNSKTGSKTGARNGDYRSWKHRPEGAMVCRYRFQAREAGSGVTILRAREPARILTAIGKEDRLHLQFGQRCDPIQLLH